MKIGSLKVLQRKGVVKGVWVEVLWSGCSAECVGGGVVERV